MSIRFGATRWRRLSPAWYRFTLTTHILVAVAWLGVVLAKLVLSLLAFFSVDTAPSLYVAMESLNIVFPPLVIATFISGVVLSLGTRWGLLDHYWVITKLALAVAVFTTGAQLSSGFAQRSLAQLLVALFASHLLMLGVATVLSVYKPWGTRELGS